MTVLGILNLKLVIHKSIFNLNDRVGCAFLNSKIEVYWYGVLNLKFLADL